jgi:hypothetical protein
VIAHDWMRCHFVGRTGGTPDAARRMAVAPCPGCCDNSTRSKPRWLPPAGLLLRAGMNPSGRFWERAWRAMVIVRLPTD